MKRLLRFFTEYKLFSFAALGIIAGLILELLKAHTAAHWVLGTIAILELFPLLWDMWNDIRSGIYGVDILAATAIITAVLLGQYWAAMVIVVMLTGGEVLEDFAHRRAQAELSELLQRAPSEAHVIRKGKTIDVKVDELHAGDKILIKPGEVVPVDAIILEGTASFDESSITGESLPQTKQVKDQLLSGAINIDGAVTAKATASAAESQYQQIIRLVRGAAGSQAPFVRLADRYSLPFTVTAFAIAGCVWAVSGHAIRFLEVIVVATPCPLILAAPIALISGMARASRYGIIVKTGSALERLAEAETIAFDKTGTLTRGELTLDHIASYGTLSQEEILALAAGLEQNSNHVVAKAIVDGAAVRQVKLKKARHVKELAGRGLQASLQGKEVLVGRLTLMKEYDVKLPTKFKPESIQQTVVYVAVSNELVGAISFTDELRPEAELTLQQLHKLGLRHTLMITGDNQATATAIAKALNIDHVHAETLPADKLHVLEEIRDRPLAFVGDGVNDAPALTAADVGIAIGARGSTAASESADMVIMPNDLSRVATALAIAKYTFKIARQSILVGISLSIILMLVFATGKFPPLAGAILQEVIDVFVIFNALRAHLFAPKSLS